MNKRIDETKKAYQSIQMPESYQEEYQRLLNHQKYSILNRSLKWVVTSLIIFTLAINFNLTIAQALSKLPGINLLVHFLTFRDEIVETEFSNTTLITPHIEGIDNINVQNKINHIIDDTITNMLNEQKEFDEEYAKAYFETGGTEENFHKIQTTIDYTIKYANEKFVSFVIEKTQILASSYSKNVYFNYDITTGQKITLQDILGQDYQEKVKNEVIRQCKERLQDKNQSFFMDEVEQLQINKDQMFYINENKQLVVVFGKYEIAPGYMGLPEFVIADAIK